ncbi:FkbM family methyltransferase [Sphingomonas lenta]|nr:FkbM family methyltransferase [Sphingomonas lenta]
MSVIERVRRRLSPMREVMSARAYRHVRGQPLFTPGETRLLDRPVVYSDRQGFLHSVQELFYDEVYRFRAKTDAPHIIDAGANIGLSVLYFKRLYPQATVVAYEPDAAICAMLRRNVADLPGVDVRQAAAWIEDTELTFYAEGSLAGSVTTDFAHKAAPVTVRAERLKDELAKRPVDFLKIDIEGAENRVLFDIEPELAQVDQLFFEYHSHTGEPQRLGDLLNLVGRAGFRYIINGAHCVRLPFVERSDQGFDLQLNISCFREP